MNSYLKIVLLVFCINLISCDNDVDRIIRCDGNCNVFKGRVYTADNIGLADVPLKVLHYSSNGIGPTSLRLVGKTKTDAMGYYTMEGFVKDDEFTSGGFYITIDEDKIENLLTPEFFKPSEIYRGTYDITNMYYIQDLEDRSQIIIADYLIPYKATFFVNLNDFNPTSTNDSFGIGNAIDYGFSGNRFFTKQATGDGFGFADGVNSTLIIPGVLGENHLRIYRSQNGLDNNIYETIILDTSNNNQPFTYLF